MIVAMVRDHGPKWSLIAGAICEARKARAARTVTGKMCRERYTNLLDPSLNHGPWTSSEQACLLAVRHAHHPRSSASHRRSRRAAAQTDRQRASAASALTRSHERSAPVLT